MTDPIAHLPRNGRFHKSVLFGSVAHVCRHEAVTFVAMRITKIPVGILYRAHGTWGVVKLKEGSGDALFDGEDEDAALDLVDDGDDDR